MAAAKRVTRPAQNLAESNHRADEGLRVFAWRVECLMNAGYDFEASWLLANSDADLHMAVSLLERGCAETTALLILL